MKELITHTLKECFSGILEIERIMADLREAREIPREARDEQRLIRSEIREDERNERRLDRAKVRLEGPKPADIGQDNSLRRVVDDCVHNIPWRDYCGKCEEQFCKHGKHNKQACNECGW
jgi:hypothetical protein